MAESATRAPRVISSLAVLALALPATLLVGVPFSLLAYGLATDFSGDLAEMGGLDWIADLTPLEFVHTLVLPGQLLLLGLALFVGLLSREPLRRRLGLVRPATPWAWVALFAVGSLVPGVLGQYLAAGLFGEPSDHLQQLGQMILTPRGLSAVYVGLCLSLLPGTCEELLFRGLVQQRLQRRWRAPLAIGLPALCFALLHMDPMHVVAVLPVGLWFGLVAWGTRSVLPAIACHAVYNGCTIAIARATADAESTLLDAVGAGVLLVATLAFGASTILLMRAGRPGQAEPSAIRRP